MANPISETPTFDGYSVDLVHRPGAVHKARLLLCRRGDRPCVIKDLSPMHPVFRIAFGRRYLEREARALEKLADWSGSPRLIERISRDAIAIERVICKHKYLHKKIPESVLPAVFEALSRAVDELHRRGFVHLDLRQRKNIMVPTDDSVVLIDFESSRYVGRGFLGQRILLPLLGRFDRAAVLKWRGKFAPSLVTEDERRRLRRHRSWMIVWPFKRIGQAVRRWFGSDRAK